MRSNPSFETMKIGQPRIKIAINGRFLTQPATGVQRYALELVRAWDLMLSYGEIDPERYQLELISPILKTPVEPFNNIPLRQQGRLSGNAWEQIELPWFTRGEFLFNPCNVGPLLKINQAVTFHDASVFAVPESYSWAFRFKYGLGFTILGRTARVIFTVSHYSKKELVQYCHIPDARLHVVYEGCDHINRIASDPGVFKKFDIGDVPFLISVGSHALHKNFSILDEAAARLPADTLEFIIAGGTFTRWFNAGTGAAPGNVRKLGYVTEGELKALYQKALALIIPSYYEGFGLPPLEAMACGCPVIASNTASLPEICGEAALYINPDRPEDLVKRIEELLEDKCTRVELSEKGTAQAEKFTWSSTARATWEILAQTVLA